MVVIGGLDEREGGEGEDKEEGEKERVIGFEVCHFQPFFGVSECFIMSHSFDKILLFFNHGLSCGKLNGPSHTHCFDLFLVLLSYCIKM